MLDFLKEIAKSDPKFEENSEKWEEVFTKVSTETTGGDETCYKEKYEKLREKYISRFETPTDTDEGKEEEEEKEEEEDKTTIEDIISEKKED